MDVLTFARGERRTTRRNTMRPGTLPLFVDQKERVSPARPFVKWVGGKAQLLAELVRHVPRTFETYHEPFVAGAALFSNRCPGRAVLYDLNARLIRTYSGLRYDPSGVIQRLREF